MKQASMQSAIVFWFWLLATAFGQERRDPTQAPAAIQQRMVAAPVESAMRASPRTSIKLKAIVLSDPDHGVAMFETAIGSIRVPLNRETTSQFYVDQDRYTISDFSASGVQVQRR